MAKRQARSVRAKPKSGSEVLDGDGGEISGHVNGGNKDEGLVSGNGNFGRLKTTGLEDNEEMVHNNKVPLNGERQSPVPSHKPEHQTIETQASNNPELQNKNEGPTSSSSTKKRKRPSLQNWSSDDDDKDHKPSYLRLTARGGYAHTNKSKQRISKANKGNTPWNKGKNRSESVKAKIKAGVQARNRAMFLEKVKHLNTTEEEYRAKQKEIKYLRERLRRAKVANNKIKAAFEEQRLKEALEKTKLSKEIERKIKNSFDEQHRTEKPRVKGLERQELEQGPKLQVGFSKDIDWKPLEIDDADQSAAYGWKCLDGGPGGLICCEGCSAAYSKYLTQTNREMETQRTSNLGYEVKELLGFLAEAQPKLSVASEAAKEKAPPPPPTLMPVSSTRKGGKKTLINSVYEDSDWDVTNAMDIATEPNVAKL